MRRRFYDAAHAGDHTAASYLAAINYLFRIDRRAAYFALSPPDRQRVRERYSLPLVTALLTRAAADVVHVPPKSLLADGLKYLLAQRAPLERCVRTPGARLDNNLVENSIRPIKLGAKNWLFIGHPSAGPRLANLYTLIENCRLAQVDPEAYLIDLLTRLLDHPANRLSDLLPHAWTPPRAARSCHRALKVYQE